MTGDAAGMRSRLTRVVREAARSSFDLVGIAPAVSPPGFQDLQEWLRRGFAGEMDWIARRENAYADPNCVLPRVRSVVMVGLNYRTDEPARPRPGQGRVSRYAWNSCDYHDIVRRRLSLVADALHDASPGVRSRAVVDTAPLLERDFARLAGLGWFGKNTLLINKWQGSWVFLGALLTDCDLDADDPHDTAHCGTCTRCLDACPTDAFPEPWVLDARKCISYLNIELRDQDVPRDLRPGLEEWVFGCDVCQDVCPWNRKAPAGDADFTPEPDLNPVDCEALVRFTQAEFAKRFVGTPLERTGRDTLVRNAAIVLGNYGRRESLEPLRAAVEDEAAIVREAARWALEQLQDRLSETRSGPPVAE